MSEPYNRENYLNQTVFISNLDNFCVYYQPDEQKFNIVIIPDDQDTEILDTTYTKLSIKEFKEFLRQMEEYLKDYDIKDGKTFQQDYYGYLIPPK